MRKSPLLVGLAVFGASCAAHVEKAPSTPPSVAKTQPAPSVARPTHKAMAAFTLPAPIVGITAPMSGEPAPSALAEARLVATTCDKISSDETDAELADMRAAVAASFDDWAKAQPACWEQMREEWKWRQEAQRQQLMWGSGVGDSFGAGGLGLSGVGQGGGGAGYGIGLGSIGTIGHGAGSGTGQGYGSARKASDYSKTNNQVAGVDEADIVKTDGTYVYLASRGALRIVEALKPRVLSVAPIAGTVRELFVEGDRAVVYSSGSGVPLPACTYGYDCVFRGDGTTTTISVFDVHDRLAPKLARTMTLSGSLMAARRIGNAVHTVVADNDSAAPRWDAWPSGMPMCGTPQAAVNAKFAQLRADNEKLIRGRKPHLPTITENGKTTQMCSSVMRTALRDGNSFTSVVSFDMTRDDVAPTTASMQSRPGAVFASDTGLYVSVAHHKPGNGRWYSYYASSVDEVSELHKFRVGAAPDKTKYIGSGTIPGHVLNQFAMDEWYGYLRVATTKGRVPDPHVESAVSILAETSNGALARVGAITGIAPGEDIRAVRFDNERGYVVTFKKTDPLFVIDTLDPQRPKILGELKIPGFSTYIHRIDADHLLSIGFDANDHGSFAYFDGVILQLFDVKTPTDPRLLHKEKIGTRGSSSEAATNHLAFNYLASRGLLAIPMTICEGGGDGQNGDKLELSGLLVYDVDLEKGFTRLGAINHGARGASCSTWWSNATSQVKRSVFLDDLVYSIADDRVKVQSLERLGTDVASLEL